MSILKSLNVHLDTLNGETYQQWFNVMGDTWFLSEFAHVGGLYGEFGFFCFFDTGVIT